jgi:hypothetical protein
MAGDPYGRSRGMLEREKKAENLGEVEEDSRFDMAGVNHLWI